MNNAKVVEREDGAVFTCAFTFSGKGERDKVMEMGPGEAAWLLLATYHLAGWAECRTNRDNVPDHHSCILLLDVSKGPERRSVSSQAPMHNAPDRSSHFRWDV